MLHLEGPTRSRADNSPPTVYYTRQGRPLAPLLTVQEVALLLLVDQTTVRRWLKDGSLEGLPLPARGRRQGYRIPLANIVRLLHLTNGETIDLVSLKEVARVLRIDPNTVRRWIKNNSLEATTLPHLGKREIYRIKRAVFQRLLTQTT